MSEEDARSFIIKIPVHRKYYKKVTAVERDYLRSRNTIQDKTMRAKPSDTSLKKYVFPGDKPVRVQSLKKEVMLLPCRRFIKYEERLRCKNFLNMPLSKRYKIRATNFKQRLYDEIPEDDVQVITELDPEFFKLVDGRPVKHQIPMFKTLQSCFDRKLRIKQDIGFKNEYILNMETNRRHELKTYELAVKQCIEQAKYFDRFISTDYKKSMVLLKQSEALKFKLDMKLVELNNLAFEKFTIVSKLIGLDHKFRVQQMYGRFLYYLSPPSWRAENREFAHSVEIERKGFDLGASEEDDTFSVIFENLVRECFTEPVHPCIYFSKPEDLMEVFEGIVKQQLNHFIHVTHITPHAKKLKEGIINLKAQMDKDSSIISGTVEKFKRLIISTEERSNELKENFFKILNGQFYDCVASPEVLKLTVHLEFSCQKVFGGEPSSSHDVLVLAKALENCYFDYSKKLDAVHSNVMKSVWTRCVESDKNKLKRAELASRELRLFNRLERELRRAFAPIVSDRENIKHMQEAAALSRKESVKTRQNSRKYTNSKVLSSPKRELTEAELDYLRFFTDWTEKEDPAKYLLSLNCDDRKFIPNVIK